MRPRPPSNTPSEPRSNLIEVHSETYSATTIAQSCFERFETTPRVLPRRYCEGSHIWFGESLDGCDGTFALRGYFIPPKEFIMTADPNREQPDIPPQKPDIQPEPRPEEIPQDKDVPEKESPPMQLY
jgi:hypothetical protein